MKIEQEIECTMETYKMLEFLSGRDKTSVGEQCQTAINTYLTIRNLPKALQQAILNLITSPEQFKCDDTMTQSLEALSQQDKTTMEAQVEKAITGYTTLRSLPPHAQKEVTNLITHHTNRGGG